MSNIENEVLITGNDVSTQSPKDTKKVYTVLEIQDMLGVGLSTIYRLIKANQFHCVRAGNRVLVPKKSFDEWLQG